MQLRFVQEHMTNWLPEYARHALRVQKAYLYPQLAQGVSSLAAMDQAFTTQVLQWIADLKRDEDTWFFDTRYDTEPYFGRFETAYAELAALSLRIIEDDELVVLSSSSS